MSSPAPPERGAGRFIIGTIATLALVAYIVWMLAFRYDIPLY